MSFDVRLGRLALVAAHDFKDAITGAGVDTVGRAVAPGDPAPQRFNVTLPVHGRPDAPGGPRVEGLRMARQARALLANAAYLLGGLFFSVAFDSDRDGWIVLPGGDVNDSDGGSSLGEFTLELGDGYRVASPATARDARRLQATDRRSSSVARDYLGQVFSTDYAAVTPLRRHYLPVGAHDIDGAGDRVVRATLTPTLEGQLPTITGATAEEVVHFEQDPAARNRGDVVIYDRRGNTT